MSKNKEFEITLPSFGGIGFDRSNKEVNDLLMDFLSEIIDGEAKDIVSNFFEETKDVDVLFGGESLCG